MKKLFLIGGYMLLVTGSYGQTVTQKIKEAFQQFETDSQLKHAISSLYVIDAKTGKVVFDKNSQIGLAPASTQKIITSVSAFELLGKNFRYPTKLCSVGSRNSPDGSLYFIVYGDPTFGSWRYSSTKPDLLLAAWADSLRKHGIKTLNDQFWIGSGSPYFDEQAVPDGWINEDVGNYYGAGTFSINWKENQYDLHLRSENVENGRVYITSVDNKLISTDTFVNNLSAGPLGSGDNAYIYLPVAGNKYLLKGSIPPNEKDFKISGAVNYGPDYFINDFRAYLQKEKLLDSNAEKKYHLKPGMDDVIDIVARYLSPSLDSIIYWFLKKSINLYGEALVKTFGVMKSGAGVTQLGIAVLKDFWMNQKLDINELNIYDGSGLSPLNRVTTHAQVEILKYAKTKDWFPYFYDALPEYNGMKKIGRAHV